MSEQVCITFLLALCNFQGNLSGYILKDIDDVSQVERYIVMLLFKSMRNGQKNICLDNFWMYIKNSLFIS